jgi:hypothetical protein
MYTWHHTTKNTKKGSRDVDYDVDVSWAVSKFFIELLVCFSILMVLYSISATSQCPPPPPLAGKDEWTTPKNTEKAQETSSTSIGP